MATEYTNTDVYGLLEIGAMKERLAVKFSTTLATEIRVKEDRFGLNPKGRRQLGWKIKRLGQTEAPAALAPMAPAPDPRAKLRAVK